MDPLLKKVFEVAKRRGKNDPDRKAKELFIRLFKNDVFRERYQKWEKESVDAMRKNTFMNEDIFLSWLKAQRTPDFPEEIQGGATNRVKFLAGAVYSFALFGKVLKWPSFGIRLEALPIIPGLEDYVEAAIIIDPEAAKEDVMKFIDKNWSQIKNIGKYNFLDTDYELGRVVPSSEHELRSVVYDLWKNGKTNTQILSYLETEGYEISSEDKPGYVRKLIDRERELRKGKSIESNWDE